MINNQESGGTALMTPSFSGDFARCELLVHSVRQCSPEMMHYLIIDQCDLAMFRILEGKKTRILVSEDLIGDFFRKAPILPNYWWSLRTLPVRGWMAQQLLKIAAASKINEEHVICCDSDVAFVRGFDAGSFLVDGRLGLLDVDYIGGKVVVWTDVARSLLKTDRSKENYRGHVGNLIAWRRPVVVAMQEHIEQHTGARWQHAIARKRTFSEYVTYGTFVREVIGYDQAKQAPSTVPLVKASWGEKLNTDADLSQFFGELDEDNIAVMMHSKDYRDVSTYRPFIEAAWSRQT